MRTTLTIDDDILVAARGIAARQQQTIDEVSSALTRQALHPPDRRDVPTRNGVPLLPHRSGVPPVTLELVNQIRDDAV